MKEDGLLTRIAERAEVTEEDAERILEVVVQDLAATLRERRGEPVVMEVPPYFDRYVTAEIGRVSGQIADLSALVHGQFEEIDQRFAELRSEMDRGFQQVDRGFQQIDGRFQQIDDRFAELRSEMDQRFQQTDRGFQQIDQRFQQVDDRFAELRRDMDQRFERVDRWFLSVGVPLVLGILAIIFKVFLGP